MNLNNYLRTLIAIAAIYPVMPIRVEAQTPTLDPPLGTFYSLQFSNSAPLPANLFSFHTYTFGAKTYIDDRFFDYSAVTPSPSLSFPSPLLVTNAGDLYLTLNLDLADGLATNILTGTTNDGGITWYQLYSTPDLSLPFSQWTAGEAFTDGGTNSEVIYDPVSAIFPTNQFFSAAGGTVFAGIGGSGLVIQTNPVTGDPLVPGQFTFFVNNTDLTTPTNDITILYSISGSATNGVDYTDGNGDPLTGSIVVLANTGSASITILPATNVTFFNPETVTLTIEPTNIFLISPGNGSATLTIQEHLFGVVLYTNEPIGIDYHSPSNSLVISYNYSLGTPNNFGLLGSNGVMRQWSGISNLEDEVKVATVKHTGNFTNGDMFFSSGTNVGYLSASGAVSNLAWGVLTNATVANTNLIEGSLYVDETGVFSNDVIVVTSDDADTPGLKGVWTLDSSRHPTLLTNLAAGHLEGVITLTNDPAKWGPWAGKIITGDEIQSFLYAVDASGGTTVYSTTNLSPGGIGSEDFDIIPTNQNLYLCDPTLNGGGAILELPSQYFTNSVGDLLITDEGNPSANAKLCIVHWDGTNLAGRTILYLRADGAMSTLEHVTFAPINIPYISP